MYMHVAVYFTYMYMHVDVRFTYMYMHVAILLHIHVYVHLHSCFLLYQDIVYTYRAIIIWI